MKNILAAAAVAAFGVSAFAAENPLSISAKFDFESRYITDGKRRVNENTQTTVSLKYFGASPTDVSFTPYVDFFWMSPTSNDRVGQTVSNEGSIKLGSEINVGEELVLDLGYKFTGWNDRASAAGMNRVYINRTNEIFFGLGKTLQLVDGDPNWDIEGTAKVRYDWNREMLVYELGVEKKWSIGNFGIGLAAVYGYIDSNKYDGDQGAAKRSNDYGYFAASADVSYAVNSGTNIGCGVRYAYNNDGDSVYADNNSNNIWWGAWIKFLY